MPRRTDFTPHQIETAVLVLMESKTVRKWVMSQAKFLEIDIDTVEGKNFLENQKRKMAEKLLS